MSGQGQFPTWTKADAIRLALLAPFVAFFTAAALVWLRGFSLLF